MPGKENDAAQAAERKAWYQAFGSKLWYFFNSLKLTLSILISLAVVSIFGTVIEQNLPVENYLRQYGEGWTRVIVMLRLQDMYHSWWFIGLLTMLVLNIIVCTFERFPPKWKSLLTHKADFDPKFIERLSANTTVSVGSDASATAGKVLQVLKKRRFKTMSAEKDGEFRVYAWKGMVGRLGSDVTHISLLVILLGAIIGSVFGYRDFLVVHVGNTMKIPGAGFEVRLDKFWIDYYESGQIRQFNSLLTVVEGDRDVLQKQIWVNEPLYYKGMRLYQSSYGMAWNRVQDAHIALFKKDAEKPEEPVTVKWGSTAAVPGTPYSVKLINYVADFAFDERTKTVYSKSAEATNPAVMLEVYKNGKLISTPWLFLKYPGIFPAIPGSDDDLVVTGYTGIMYSGLSLNKDPGTNIVWLGTAIMGVGFILAFFVFHKRVWISVRNSGNSSEVRIGGLINKNTMALEKEISEIAEAIKG